MQCLATLVSPDELREFLLNPRTGQGKQAWDNSGFAKRAGFRSFVLPYLDAAAIATWRDAAKALWDPSAWSADFYIAPAPAFFYGAMLGLHDEVRALIEQWPDTATVFQCSFNPHCGAECQSRVERVNQREGPELEGPELPRPIWDRCPGDSLSRAARARAAALAS